MNSKKLTIKMSVDSHELTDFIDKFNSLIDGDESLQSVADAFCTGGSIEDMVNIRQHPTLNKSYISVGLRPSIKFIALYETLLEVASIHNNRT